MKHTLFIALPLLLVACASHQPIATPSLGQGDRIIGMRNRADGVEVIFHPIVSIEEHKKYFDDDLILYNMLPVQTLIENNEVTTSLMFKAANYILIDDKGDVHPMLSIEEVMSRAEKSFGRTVGWAVAFGLLGAIPSAINVSNTNERLRADYQQRALTDTSLAKNQRTEGMAFFPVDKNTQHLFGWTLRLTLENDAPESGAIVFEQRLVDYIPQRTSAN